MAQALKDMLGERLDQGFVVVKYDHGLPLKRICQAEAGHPVPDEAGVRATGRMLEMARTSTERDLLICLLTGGASALTPAPAPGLSLADLRQTTQLLLDCGATIHELNAVRKHLSAFSGGQLAARRRARHGAQRHRLRRGGRPAGRHRLRPHRAGCLQF